ncbi:MAG: imidazolonepropionase [Pseudomonadota bacterium]
MKSGGRYPDLLIRNIGELATLASPRPGPRAGRDLDDIAAVSNGAVVAAGGRIIAAGPDREIAALFPPGPATRQVDAGGRLVTPGLVDAHTHLVFAGARDDEFRLKIVDGLGYEEIEARGGGVPASVRLTRAAGMDDLLAQARPVLRRMMKNGATTIEAKSGYALNLEGEMRLLEAMRLLDREGPVEIVPTLFGAHDMPPEFVDRPDDFLELIVTEMIPAAAARGLARFYDSGVTFSPEKTERLFAAAKKFGLRPKVHADEFAHRGGAALAARCGAVSAEHCLNSSADDLAAMRRAGVIAVLLPAVPLVHRLGRFVDARRFIAAGLAVALGTDFNPGCPVESMSLVISLACYTAGLSPAEALAAATINAAHAIGRGDDLGSLEPGKQADLVVWDAPNHARLCANPSGGLAGLIVKKGEIVWENDCRV